MGGRCVAPWLTVAGCGRHVMAQERQAYKEKLDAEQRKKERATTKKDLSTALQRFAPRPQ